MKFEWDENKARSNLTKHHVSFDLAREVFSQSIVLTFEDDRIDYGEKREVAISEVEGVCLYIIFTMRGDSLRIISARKASAKERRGYYDHIKRRTISNSSEDE